MLSRNVGNSLYLPIPATINVDDEMDTDHQYYKLDKDHFIK